MLLDPRNGPAFDLPAFDGPRRIFVVASTPRSGSTLLCRGLWDAGRVGAPKEYLNPMQIRDWEVRLGSGLSRRAHAALRGPAVGLAGRVGWSPERRDAHLERVMVRRTGPSGWFGLKLHRHHAAQWFGPDGDLPWPVAQWIWIRRRDRVAQAISWARALQTGRWASWQRGLPARYSEARVRQCEAELATHEGAWSRWFAARAIDPLVVRYEALVDDWEGEMTRVFEALGEPGSVPEKATARQADGVSEAWRSRYDRR